MLDKNANSIVGIDISEGMLTKARTKCSNYNDKATFIKHNMAQSLPFDNESFDIVNSSLVLEHKLTSMTLKLMNK